MKEPKKIKLTDSPESKKVNLTPLPSLMINKYPEPMNDDLYLKEEVDINPNPTFEQIINWERSLHEDNKQDNP